MPQVGSCGSCAGPPGASADHGNRKCDTSRSSWVAVTKCNGIMIKDEIETKPLHSNTHPACHNAHPGLPKTHTPHRNRGMRILSDEEQPDKHRPQTFGTAQTKAHAPPSSTYILERSSPVSYMTTLPVGLTGRFEMMREKTRLLVCSAFLPIMLRSALEHRYHHYIFVGFFGVLPHSELAPCVTLP